MVEVVKDSGGAQKLMDEKRAWRGDGRAELPTRINNPHQPPYHFYSRLLPFEGAFPASFSYIPNVQNLFPQIHPHPLRLRILPLATFRNHHGKGRGEAH